MKDVAQFFKALADECRLKVLWLLLNHKELCVCDIMEALGITQSKASRHLATLRHAGLVTDRKVGAWSYYSLSPVDNDLKRGVIKTLREKLGGHPEAPKVLEGLRTWLDGKDRGATCMTGLAQHRSARRKKPLKSHPGENS